MQFENRQIFNAKNGDVEAAQKLLNEFRKTFRREVGSKSRGKLGGFPSVYEDDLLDYIVSCFEKLFTVDGHWIRQVNVTQALNLSVEGKSGPKPKTSRNFSLGLLVSARYIIEKENTETKRRGETPLERAIFYVSEEEFQTVETVRRGYKEYRAALKAALDKKTLL